MDPQLQIPEKELASLCRRYRLKRLSLFGSAARPDFSPDSDIDLLVEFESGQAPSLGGLVELKDELSALFGREVDVATTSILRNPYRGREVRRDLTTLYAA